MFVVPKKHWARFISLLECAQLENMSSRPWRDAPKPKKTLPNAGPLIPTKYMHATTQRLVVTALFFLLQGIKLTRRRGAANFLLFSILDTVFVYLLSIFSIPRLNFRTSVMVVQALLLVVLDYSVFISAEWLWTALVLLLKPILSIFGMKGYSNVPQLPRGSSYLGGKYVVDILPEASAKLDTIAPLCVDTKAKQQVYLRLSLENTWPSAIQLSRADLGNSSSYNHITFDKRQVSRLPAEKSDSKLYLPIKEAGAYYLDRITDDQTGLRVKIHRDRIVVPPCPQVKLRSLSDEILCEGAEFRVEVEAHGLTPLMVLLDGTWQTLGNQLEEDGVETVRLELSRLGGSQASVTRVKDRSGIVLDVAETVSAKILRPAVASVPQGQHIANIDGSALAQFSVDGDIKDAPFTLSFEAPGSGDVKKIHLNHPGTHQIRVTEIGVFKLTELHGSRCPGLASGEFEVFSPPPASLDVKFNVVEDKCAGPTGIDALLSLHGTAPFKVEYRTLRGSRVVSQRVADFEEASGILKFRPKEVGEYQYEILQVRDVYRHQAFDQGDTKYAASQSITELPGAHFLPLTTTKLCGSSNLSVDISVRGRGPFTLKYSIDDMHEHSITTGEPKDQDRVRLDLDFSGGTHFVRLISLTDRNNCVTKLPGIRTPDIFVQPDLPFLAWKQPGELKTAEPVNLPLKLAPQNINYPATLEYEREFKGSKTKHSVVLKDLSSEVIITEPGSYRLVRLNDNVCFGSVDSESLVIVSLHERPRIDFVEDSLSFSKCHNSNDGESPVMVNLIGAAPFTVIHEVVDPSGSSSTQNYKQSKTELPLNLLSALVGRYKHYLWIMDSRYPDFNRSLYTVFEHEIYPRAEAAFVNLHKKLQVCENSEIALPIPVALRGKAPFKVTIQVGKETKEIEAKQGSQLDLRKYLSTFTQTGPQKVKLLGITDANKCDSVTPSKGSSPSHEFNIQVLPQPIFPELKKLDYCVGEKISFLVTKSPSLGNEKLSVDYMWGKKRQMAKVSEETRLFEKYATGPGEMTLMSVKDSNGCQNLLPEPKLVARVHPLPHSRITKEPHYSIYEGEQISLGFAFEGTAPFTFRYTRSVDGQVKETKQVKNVMESTYNIIVDEGGEYEIVELRDKFCRSKRE